MAGKQIVAPPCPRRLKCRPEARPIVYRIVLIGVERKGVEAVVSALAGEGHAVIRAAPEEDAAHLAAKHRPHLVVADAISLGARLEEWCRSLERLTAPASVPVLLLADEAWLAEHDLPAGVTDMICEPAGPAEVRVRVRRAVWPEVDNGGDEILRVGPLAIDHARHQAFCDGRPLDLTLREYDLLSFLAAHPGRVFSREALLDRVWGLDYLGGTRTVDVHIRRLRVKLDDEVGRLLQTVRGVGYRLNPEADGGT